MKLAFIRNGGFLMKQFKTVVLVFLVSALTALSIQLNAATLTLARTGQTKCYANNGSLLACAGTGQDGDFQMGVAWPSPRFTDNGDGTMTDNLTGLMWLKDANCSNTIGYNPDGGLLSGMYWQTGLNFIAGINAGNFPGCSAGYNDWRFPNINELESLVNRDQPSQSNWLISQGFQNVQSHVYWSSTTTIHDFTYAWDIVMQDGIESAHAKDVAPGVFNNQYYVWPVRGVSNGPAPVWRTGQSLCYDGTGLSVPCAGTGQDGDLQVGVAWPNPRFTDHGNGTVTDHLTGLMWLKDIRCPPRTSWINAFGSIAAINAGTNYFCKDYTAGTYNDWRMPNAKEMWSLFDFSQVNPAFPVSQPFYPGAPWGNDIWGSTTWVNVPSIDFTGHFMWPYLLLNSKSAGTSADTWMVRVGGGGSVCADMDADTICDNVDNCINDYNPSQADSDNDGLGDACDPQCTTKFADADATLAMGQPTTNFGGGALSVGALSPPTRQDAIIHFPLTSVPANALVVSGDLTLNQFTQSGGPQTMTMSLAQTSWVESLVTWLNFGAPNVGTLIGQGTNPVGSGAFTLPITVSAPITGYLNGVVVKGTSGNAIIYNREVASVIQRPRLKVCYVIPEP